MRARKERRKDVKNIEKSTAIIFTKFSSRPYDESYLSTIFLNSSSVTHGMSSVFALSALDPGSTPTTT